MKNNLSNQFCVSKILGSKFLAPLIVSGQIRVLKILYVSAKHFFAAVRTALDQSPTVTNIDLK